MKVAVIKECRAHERRVAASPDSVKHMVSMGLEPVVESGAGAEACFADSAYSAAGATIVGDAATALAAADIVLKVQRPLIGGAQGTDGVDELGLIEFAPPSSERDMIAKMEQMAREWVEPAAKI